MRVVTSLVAERGFVLAGAGALIEYGFVDRFTADIDLFTNVAQDIGATAAELAARLVDDEFDVVVVRATPHFARLAIDELEVDLAHNWRGDPPGRSEIGPILSVRDAIAGKIEALFTRLENRDVVDVAQLLEFYSMAEMAQWAKDRDEGFSLDIVHEMVSQNVHRPDAGFDASEYEAARARVIASIAVEIDRGASLPAADVDADGPDGPHDEGVDFGH